MSELQTILRVVDANNNRTRVSVRDIGRRSEAHLERLPDGLSFPAGLRDKVSFDAERHELIFRGYMSSANFYFLRACCDDPEYLEAVDELHHQATFEPLVRPQLVPMWLWALVAVSFALACLVWLCWLTGAGAE